MNGPLAAAAAGVGAAIVITTTMDATGYSVYSALPLLPLTAIFWFAQKYSRQEIGLTRGGLPYHALAVLYPLVVLGAIGVIAYFADAVDTADTDMRKAMANMALLGSTGLIMVLITEEGFFRGWLWATLNRAGLTEQQTLVWTTLAFTAWHVSAVTLDTGFDLPAGEIPIYLINATLIGAVFGTLRLASGSVFVATVCHAVWNAIDYPFFGFGEHAGALGIENTRLYGPEVGLLGIAFNTAFALGLWWLVRRRKQRDIASTG